MSLRKESLPSPWVWKEKRGWGDTPPGVFLEALGVVPLPAGDVHGHQGPLLVVRVVVSKALEAVGYELHLAALGLQALLIHQIAGAQAGDPASGILLPVLGKPAQRRRGGRLAIHRDNIVALFKELFPGDLWWADRRHRTSAWPSPGRSCPRQRRRLHGGFRRSGGRSHSRSWTRPGAQYIFSAG